MGKRSEFERIERDYYRTFDPKAGAALKPYIPEGSTYIEPFAGEGDLIKQLDWLQCIWKSDIEPQADDIEQFDAFDYNESMISWTEVDYLISNTPWRRDIFHKAIDHFVPMIDCWFLIDSGWMLSQRASFYMTKYVTDVVVIGRMKWIPDTKMSSKDDCVWLRMSRNKNGATLFHPRFAK